MLESVVFLLALSLTWWIRRFALAGKLLDIPNERSLHTLPTPRGGGLAIVVAFYSGALWLYFRGELDPVLLWGVLCALPVAAVSMVDDAVSLSPKIRLAVQGLSAVAALWLLREHLALDLYWFRLEGVWTAPIFFLAILWLTNLYNFLDGIDGYAASEAIFVSWGAYLFFHSKVLLLLGFAALGFLCFNRPKASIFMGDVGSAFLGFVFAVFAIYFSDRAGALWIWLVLLGLFWFDATLTLWRRYRNGERLSQAHRKHAYQRIVQAGWTHRKTLLAGMALNLLGLALLYPAADSPWIVPVAMVWMVVLYRIVRYIDSRKAFS